ncbi:sulfite exporter TauE/SafE family protein [Brachybacterium saurashtrense]|uniref:Probable membrane transporter protein n=1 Tax=Brachybacterium saurashtrense TaxID=556288 RepID=A0A345YNY7_9MICO|nr:sulfite exporter TauE/SafE family protein [Brachybacterium saurashtrense]AXK45639.1 sulfite exporter TauE/SafE family protein [Brachybacterium saurashtrense]RRR24656.1 sulfite exporter TauE/SafE family protein [Brachybacterium saurashtrense]
MEPLSLLVLLALGTLAGAINAAVGSGSLLTLPVLLALGIPPGTAVRTNTIGILFSTLGSTYGYRREIARERGNLGPLVLVTAVCATAGALLLLASPVAALDVVVPILIVVALAMVLFQKRLTAALRARSERRAARRRGSGASAPERSPYRSPALVAAMGGASVYGGYFTAAQGVLYLGVLGTFTGRAMGSVNSIKNLLSLVVNLAAALVYLVAHLVLGVEVVWLATAAIAVGALLGGYFGAHLAKRMPEWLLRGIIVAVALIALVRQVL